jgi:dTDP-glucose pyrophosphorylase
MDELLIVEEESILQALKQLDKTAKKILFVHKNGKLIATITDGDVRRWILNNGDLKAPLSKVANYHPKFLYEEQENQAAHVMNKYAIDAIPILNKKYEIKKVIYRKNSIYNKKENKFTTDVPIVIMAGGKGTRLHPYTNILPKPLIPIGDLPITEHIINRFYNQGCKKYYMIVNYKRNIIKAYFDDLEKDYSIEFVNEDNELGTGGGISLLKGMIKSTFILTNCDILIDEDMTKVYEYHKKNGNVITMICSLKNFTVPYGVVEIGNNYNLESIREKPELSFFVNTGCYIVEPDVIEFLEYNEPIDFTTIIEKCQDNTKKVGVYPIGENAWMDMGQMDELEKMKTDMGYK